MKYTLLILAFMMFSVTAMAQELPEPTAPLFEYKAEIAWGTASSMIWEAIPITYELLDGIPPSNHKYWGVGFGDKMFDAVAMESTAQSPKFIRITANIISLPATGNKWWGNFFRIRIYAVIDIDGQALETPRSDASFWVAIVSLIPPSRPIGG